MDEFKTGDRVKCIAEYEGLYEAVDKVGTVFVDAIGLVVIFDIDVNGWDFGESGYEQHNQYAKKNLKCNCWEFPNSEEYLQLENQYIVDLI